MAEDTSVCGIALKQQQLNWIQADGDENDSDRVMNRWGFVCLFNNPRDSADTKSSATALDWHITSAAAAAAKTHRLPFISNDTHCLGVSSMRKIYFLSYWDFSQKSRAVQLCCGSHLPATFNHVILVFKETSMHRPWTLSEFYSVLNLLWSELWHSKQFKKIWKTQPIIIRKMPLLCVIYKSLFFFHWTSDTLLGK